MSDPEKPGLEQDAGTDEADSSLARWRRIMEGEESSPIHSTRQGIVGWILVRCKRLLRPLVNFSLWEQRDFNVAVLDQLEGPLRDLRDLHRDLTQVRNDLKADVKQHARRLAHLEEFKREGLDDITRHSDALFGVLDQKFDRYRRDSRALWSKVGALLATSESDAPAELVRAHAELEYQDLEERFRGDEADIAERLAIYRPYVEGKGSVLDLGCGRGEALATFAGMGVESRGVDSSAEMVRHCRDKGLLAEEGDLFEALERVEEGSLGGVVSFHVIEHLPAQSIARLVRLAWRALEPRGVLILETPNPLSVLVAARNFWLDPTHQRPFHPDTLELLYEQAGFERVERLDLRPFGDEQRLPELDLTDLDEDLHALAHRVNELRDRIDDLFFGFQDYALIGRKPG